MKKCPNCQKTFDDDKRFCQIDGTPLVEAIEPPQTEDPFKTVVVGKQDIPIPSISQDPMKTTVISGDPKDDDILQIPEVFDPMKTIVVSEPIKFEKPVENPVVNEPSISTPELPKFNEPSLTPPNFGDLTSSEPPKFEEPKAEPKFEAPIANPFSDPPKFDKPIANPFSEPPKFEVPAPTPFNETPTVIDSPKFDSNPLPSESSPMSSPFEVPKNEPIQSPFQTNEPPPPPFKEPESPFSAPPSPFDPTPFQSNEPAMSQPLQQAEWNPPSPPVQDWQNQSIGAETPFQPPVVSGGKQNQTLGIVTLILGILGFLCIGFIAGVPALITGFMTMKKVKSDPAQYGGKTLAIIGMILGGLGTLWSLAYVAFVLIALLSNMR